MMTGLDKRDQGLIPSPRRGSRLLTRARRDGGTGPQPPGWELVVGPSAVAVLTGSETVAEAHVWERDGLVILEFWIDGVDLPRGLGVDLVEQAFAHPAVHVHRPVLACVPARGEELLQQASRHIEDARTRTTGLTCLIEGRIRQADTSVR